MKLGEVAFDKPPAEVAGEEIDALYQHLHGA
jgi:ABC-type phosphate/phosphonate transport system ATPase subunit